MMGFVLYAILGGVLAMSGVSVMDKPINFIAIMALVILIDVYSANR